MNSFKVRIADYQRDTAHMTMIEHGAHILMMQHYCATEKPLPTGKELYRLLRAQDKIERAAIDTVTLHFWRMADDGLVNDRAAEDIARARSQADTNSRIAGERENKRKAARKQNEPRTGRETKPAGSTTIEPGARIAELSAMLRQCGVEVGENDAIVQKWIGQNIADEIIMEALGIAKQRRRMAGDKKPISTKYLGPIVQGLSSRNNGSNSA